ncbi:MAG: GAF domain-containing protein, partial [Chloroflexi bacterium]|nr:GAF domain-containing protein [Chloroflexota bacterium]
MASNSPRVTKRDLPPPTGFDDGEAATRPDPSLYNYPSAEPAPPTPAAELEAVRQLSLSLTASLDLPTVLETILKIVFQLMKGAKNVHVFSYDSENDRLTFGAAVRSDGRKAAPWPAPRPHGLTYTVARGGETVAVSDMSTHPLYASAPGHWGGAIVGLPLKIGQRVVGVMNVAYPRPHTFSEAELATLRLLADQAALAIENARLYQVERRRAEQLVGLHEITRALGVITDSNESYGIMTRRLAELLGARLCLLLFYEPHKAELCAKPAAYGIDDETLLTIRYSLHDAQQILDLHRHDVFVANHQTDKPELFDLLARHLQIDSLMVASIGRMVGLIVIANKPGGFNNDDARLVSIFSNQTRALIENAELFAEMSETLSREKRLNDISRVIGGTLDLPSVLSNIVRLAAELVGADAGSLGLVSADGQIIDFPYLYNLPDIILGPLPKGQGIAWHVIETGELVLLRDYSAHPKANPPLIEADVKAFIGVPVVAGDVRLGALGLFSLDPARVFGKRDLALAASIGRQAGVAIQNARLFEAEHRQVAALTALHETS